jgi:hypothetical protein
LWFFLGVLVGGAVLFIALRSPYTQSGVDLDGDGDGDGVDDETYHYAGATLDRVDYDRNGDRKVDARWFSDVGGAPVRYESDDNFDGRFEKPRKDRSPHPRSIRTRTADLT